MRNLPPPQSQQQTPDNKKPNCWCLVKQKSVSTKSDISSKQRQLAANCQTII